MADTDLTQIKNQLAELQKQNAAANQALTRLLASVATLEKSDTRKTKEQWEADIAEKLKEVDPRHLQSAFDYVSYLAKGPGGEPKASTGGN